MSAAASWDSERGCWIALREKARNLRSCLPESRDFHMSYLKRDNLGHLDSCWVYFDYLFHSFSERHGTPWLKLKQLLVFWFRFLVRFVHRLRCAVDPRWLKYSTPHWICSPIVPTGAKTTVAMERDRRLRQWKTAAVATTTTITMDWEMTTIQQILWL